MAEDATKSKQATESLQRQSQDTVGSTAFAAAALTLAAAFSRRLPVEAPASIVRYLTWLSLGELVSQFSLLPFLYGTSYLTKAPSCVKLRMSNPFTRERNPLGIAKGFLISGLESESTTIKLLKVEKVETVELHLVNPAHVDAVEFWHDCGSMMPNYVAMRSKEIKNGSGSHATESAQ